MIRHTLEGKCGMLMDEAWAGPGLLEAEEADAEARPHPNPPFASRSVHRALLNVTGQARVTLSDFLSADCEPR